MSRRLCALRERCRSTNEMLAGLMLTLQVMTAFEVLAQMMFAITWLETRLSKVLLHIPITRLSTIIKRRSKRRTRWRTRWRAGVMMVVRMVVMAMMMAMVLEDFLNRTVTRRVRMLPTPIIER